VRGVLPVSNNSFVVIFDRVPKSLDPQAVNSATNEENFTLAMIDPTLTASDGTQVVPKGTVVPTRFPYVGLSDLDDLDPEQVQCFTDSAIQPGVKCSVTISPTIRGEDCETFSGPNVFEFIAPLLPDELLPVELSEERYRDFDYIIDPAPGETGQTYRLEATGDIGIQDARTSLRKRIYRRVFTEPGSFAWAPQYGVGIGVKSLAKGQRLQELASLISRQILLEPDVTNVGVETFLQREETGSFLIVECYVQQRDARSRRFTFREPI